MQDSNLPILITGAGPSGLAMACALQQHGIKYRIIDKLPQPVTTSNALAIHSRTQEILADLDILPAATADANKLYATNLYAEGEKILHIDLSDIDSPYPYILGLPQQSTEKVFNQRLQALHANVERPAELISIFQNDNSVTARVKYSHNEREEEIRCQYVVAADGSHSIVRKLLDLNFAGESLAEHFIMADVKIHWPLPHDQVHAFMSKDGVMAVLPLKDFSRVIADVSHTQEFADVTNPSLEHFKTIAKQRCPVAIEFEEPTWTSHFWINQRQIAQYRHQRVFFIGDAAHIHSPVGGQGMNTGIQDAYNLAWKLALAIHGKASDNLLDSYHAERHPVAEGVLRATGMMTKMITVENPKLKKLRNTSLQNLAKLPAFRHTMADQMAEVKINYHKSPIVANEAINWLDLSKLTSNMAFAKGPKAGARLPEQAVARLQAPNDSLSLYELLKGPQHTLLLFAYQSTQQQVQQLMAIGDWAKQYYPGLMQAFLILTDAHQITPESLNEAWQSNVLIDANAQCHARYGAKAASIYLIRPDKHIGYRGQVIDRDNVEGYLQKVLV